LARQIRIQLGCPDAQTAVGWDMIGPGLHNQKMVEGSASGHWEKIVGPGGENPQVDRRRVVQN